MSYNVLDKDDLRPGDIVGLVVLGVVVLLLLISAFTCFYTVKADEVAVVQRFGKVVDQTEPGLHLKLPLGIESTKNIPIRKVFKEEFGFRTLKADVKTEYDPRDFPEESVLLTGDLNISDVEWVIQYKINNPVDYLFSVRNPKSILRDLSEATMSKIVGDRTVTEVLTIGRIEIAAEVKQSLQELLDLYKTGIQVTTVTLQDVNPPEAVKAAFNEVNEAKQKKETLINEAWKGYNEAVPKAKGLALQQISEAEGYALKRVNEATGEADRFNAILDEYSKAKNVTRQRFYLEVMTEILPQIEEIFVIDEQTKGLIPLLHLGDQK